MNNKVIMECEKCGFKSDYEEEVCWYSKDGWAVGHDSIGYEPNEGDLALCNECASVEFEYGKPITIV